jgi:hypothetical protein
MQVSLSISSPWNPVLTFQTFQTFQTLNISNVGQITAKERLAVFLDPKQLDLSSIASESSIRTR